MLHFGSVFAVPGALLIGAGLGVVGLFRDQYLWMLAVVGAPFPTPVKRVFFALVALATAYGSGFFFSGALSGEELPVRKSGETPE
jgi:hypothetical protein